MESLTANEIRVIIKALVDLREAVQKLPALIRPEDPTAITRLINKLSADARPH